MFISYTKNEEKKSLSPRKKEKVEVFYNRGVVEHCMDLRTRKSWKWQGCRSTTYSNSTINFMPKPSKLVAIFVEFHFLRHFNFSAQPQYPYW